ncbi:MAG: CAP domain-containing protein [Bilifractor sp.]|jgi:hypothetical protein
MKQHKTKTVIRTLTALLAAAVMMIGAMFSETVPVSAASSTILDNISVTVTYNQSDVSSMADSINSFRSGKGKSALSYDYGLEEIAIQRAGEVSVSLSSTRPDNTAFSTATASNGATASGELRAMGSYGAAVSTILNKWTSSQTIVGDYQAVGIAHVKDSRYKTDYWVAEFGNSTGITTRTTLSGSKKNVSFNYAKERLVTSAFSQWLVNPYKNNALSTGGVYYVRSGSTTSLPKLGVSLRFKDGLPKNKGLIYYKDLTWTSSNSSIASISGTSLKGGKTGNTTITATNLEGNAVSVSVHCVSGSKKPMYRMYNKNSGEHFYTANQTERNNLRQAGWRYEGIGWYAPAASNIPVYRLYNANAGDHHYTTNEREVSNLINAGWKYEGIGWYSDENKGVPLYRQYNPNAVSGSHNYTTSKTENDHLVALGWRAEGIGWYGLK